MVGCSALLHSITGAMMAVATAIRSGLEGIMGMHYAETGPCCCRLTWCIDLCDIEHKCELPKPLRLRLHTHFALSMQ